MSTIHNDQRRMSITSTNTSITNNYRSKRLGSIDITKEAKIKRVTFSSDFVNIIPVESWKMYNIDCSIFPCEYQSQSEPREKNKEKIKCNCILY